MDSKEVFGGGTQKSFSPTYMPRSVGGRGTARNKENFYIFLSGDTKTEFSNLQIHFTL